MHLEMPVRVTAAKLALPSSRPDRRETFPSPQKVKPVSRIIAFSDVSHRVVLIFCHGILSACHGRIKTSHGMLSGCRGVLFFRSEEHTSELPVTPISRM